MARPSRRQPKVFWSYHNNHHAAGVACKKDTPNGTAASVECQNHAHTNMISYTLGNNTVHLSVFIIVSGEKICTLCVRLQTWCTLYVEATKITYFVWLTNLAHTCMHTCTRTVNLGKWQDHKLKSNKTTSCVHIIAQVLGLANSESSAHTQPTSSHSQTQAQNQCCCVQEEKKEEKRGEKKRKNVGGNLVKSSVPNKRIHTHKTNNHQINCSPWSTGKTGKIYMIVKMDNFTQHNCQQFHTPKGSIKYCRIQNKTL